MDQKYWRKVRNLTYPRARRRFVDEYASEIREIRAGLRAELVGPYRPGMYSQLSNQAILIMMGRQRGRWLKIYREESSQVKDTLMTDPSFSRTKNL